MTDMPTIEELKAQAAALRNDLSRKLRDERSRARGPIVGALHELSSFLGEGGPFFSQFGQDRIVDRLLGGKRDGTFADIGGFDGVTGSNTLFFELMRGWSGVLVEAAPRQFAKAQAVRRCACVPAAVGASAGDLDFMEVTAGFTQMSGFLDSYDPDLLKRVRADARHTEVIHTLPVRPLGEILKEAGLTRIDYLSLDIEGGEMSVLRGFDFDAFDIDILSIENNARQTDLPRLMQDKGYSLIEFAGVDDLYRKTENLEPST